MLTASMLFSGKENHIWLQLPPSVESLACCYQTPERLNRPLSKGGDKILLCPGHCRQGGLIALVTRLKNNHTPLSSITLYVLSKVVTWLWKSQRLLFNPLSEETQKKFTSPLHGV